MENPLFKKMKWPYLLNCNETNLPVQQCCQFMTNKERTRVNKEHKIDRTPSHKLATVKKQTSQMTSSRIKV